MLAEVHINLFALGCKESGKTGLVALLGQVWVMPPILPLAHQGFQIYLPLQAYINVTGMLHFKIEESGLISLF